MKFCDAHWAVLRAAIDVRGLSPFVAKSGQEVARRMADSGPVTRRSQEARQGRVIANTRDSFEPLMGAHWMIVQRLGEIGGTAVLFQDGCPICFANSEHVAGCTAPNCTYSYDDFIDRAADDELTRAIQLGLIEHKAG